MFAEIDTLRALGYVAAWLAWAALGFALPWLARRNGGVSRPALRFMAAVWLSAAWGLTAWWDLGSTKLISWHLALFCDHARYALWCLFLQQLLRPLHQPATPEVPAPLLSAGLPALLLGLSLLANHWLGQWAGEAVPAMRWLSIIGLAWAVLLLLLIEQLFRNQADGARWEVKPLSLGLGAMAAFDIYLFSQGMMFERIDADVLAVRGLVHAMTVPLLWLAVHRQKGWQRRLQFSRGAMFYSATLLVIGLYLVFIAGVGYYVRYFGGSWGGALQVALLFGALVGLVLTMASGTSRARFKVFLGKHFFRYRYDYRREWLRFTSMLASARSPQEVGATVVRGLADLVESPAGALWYRAVGDEGHVQSAAWNFPVLDAVEPPDSSLCTLMREREWIVTLPPGSSRQQDGLVLLPWLQGLDQAWLVIPLLVGEQLMGFVVLARPRTAIELDWEVRDLLKTAARQAAGFLAQIHATEALLEARKFDAFNRMSAFVVHDLKNIITQLSLMMKNIDRHGHKPEFQQDMRLTIESSLEKMRQLMLQLREGAKPVGTASGVDLAQLLQRTQDMARQRGRELETDIVDRVSTRGHADRLERVVGHLVQNALDATPASGRVWVRLVQDAGRARLEVGDTGAGMSAEFIRNRLFRPFASTKQQGMGIGSYESHQYIRELGGSIDVKSELGQGTVMAVLLPLLEVRTASDLRAAEGGA
ncbi:MAG: hypothetical protein RIQ53_820 [Pseudomonadota bacterium]